MYFFQIRCDTHLHGRLWSTYSSNWLILRHLTTYHFNIKCSLRSIQSQAPRNKSCCETRTISRWGGFPRSLTRIDPPSMQVLHHIQTNSWRKLGKTHHAHQVPSAYSGLIWTYKGGNPRIITRGFRWSNKPGISRSSCQTTDSFDISWYFTHAHTSRFGSWSPCSNLERNQSISRNALQMDVLHILWRQCDPTLWIDHAWPFGSGSSVSTWLEHMQWEWLQTHRLAFEAALNAIDFLDTIGIQHHHLVAI